MKLLFRLSLTTLSLLLFLLLAYLALPSLLAEIARYQLSQLGFTDIEIKVGPVGFESATIDFAEMSNQGIKISLQNLKTDYQLAKLLYGSADAIHIEGLSLFQISDETGVKTNFLPSPEMVAGILSLAWHEFIPARSLMVENLLLYAADGTLALEASGEITRQAQQISGQFSLLDSRNKAHRIDLLISPETGIDFQLISPNKSPLSVNLKTLNGGSGLAGSVSLDLAQIGEMTGQADNLTGLLEADVAYFSAPGSGEMNFTISATGKQPGLSDMQAQAMQADLEGSIGQKGDEYRLEFPTSSQISLNQLKQGPNTLEKLIFELPKILTIKNGEMLLSHDRGGQIQLSSLILEDIHIPRAQLDKITLKPFEADRTAGLCEFGLQLTAPLVKIGDMLIKPDPVQLSGVCPDREEAKWSVNAKTQSIIYEDTDYQLSLGHCEMDFGNSEQGKLLDEDPAELGGTFSCDIDQPGGKLVSRIRFNPANSAGHIRYSVSDIQLDDEHPLFSSVLKNWSQPVEIVSGSLSAQGSYRWWKNRNGLNRSNLTLDLNLNDAGGHYEGILFSGLNYQDSFNILPEFSSSEFSPLSIDHIDIAIPISHATAKIRFTQPEDGPLPLLEIDDLKLFLLDGRVSGKNLRINFNEDEQYLLFNAESLDLAQIIELQQLEGLTASGRLNGTIPVIITPKGMKIIGGKIVAQDPGGYIRYIPAMGTAEAGKSVPGSELVLKILEDLYYDSLKVDVDYDEDGLLRMKLAIKGKSPQVDANRPIHFNLELEQNLLTLLKGLRYVEGINNDIDKNVKKYVSEQKKSLD